MEIEKAQLELKSFEEKSQNKYAAVVKSWKNNLETLSTFFKYRPEIRRIIYTTNFIENVHRQLRKVFKNRWFTNDEALKKLLFLTIQKTSKKWGNMQNWALIYSQLVIIFGDRLKAWLNWFLLLLLSWIKKLKSFFGNFKKLFFKKMVFIKQPASCFCLAFFQEKSKRLFVSFWSAKKGR